MKTGIVIIVIFACVVGGVIYFQSATTQTDANGPTVASQRGAALGADASARNDTAAAIATDGDKTASDPGAIASTHAARDFDTRISGVPTPLSVENVERVSKFAAGLAAQNERQRDFLSLATSEEADPQWSPQMEEYLAGSLREHYGGMAGLEVSNVRCTRSICAMSAVANSSAITGASDWQSLMGSVMNETWFREQFFDASTSMGTDGRGLIYITYFVRKKDG